MKVVTDTTNHERFIQIEGAPDLYTRFGRGGTWYSPSFLKVTWMNDGARNVWVGGMKRNKNGDLGRQDTGEWFGVDDGGYSKKAPSWVQEIIKGELA